MSLGYDAIDLDPIFFERHRRTGERFEFSRDGHWSAVGHGATFDAVMASRFMLRLLAVNSNRAEKAPLRRGCRARTARTDQRRKAIANQR